ALINTAEIPFVVLGGGILIHYNSDDDTAVIPDDVKIIGERAFSYKKNLKKVTIPNGTERICEYAFESCESLEEIILPESLKYLEGHAFAGCHSLKNIVMPSKLDVMGSDVFYDTPALNEAEGEFAILSDKYLLKYRGFASEVSFSANIEYICGGAFSGCDTIQRINIPDTVAHIGANAFEWCRELSFVDIPEKVVSVGASAFAHCRTLTAKLHFSGAKDIGKNAFFRGTRLVFDCGGREFSVKLKTDLLSDKDENSVVLTEFAAKPDTAVFDKLTEKDYKLPIALCFYDTSEKYKEYLEQNAKDALLFAVDEADAKLLDKLFSLDILSADDVSEGINYAIDSQKTEIQTQLLRYKHEKWGDIAEARIDEKFRL
ncbi:MAG: leucine-rich repeat domain-containing protein, partial [Firmicutes bacterium]|nr:leucine-rich repeat domain-containing protein [Bacillota bacterium]